MKTLCLAMLVSLVSLVAALPATAADGDWDEKKLQQMYMEFLGGEGYRPEIDEDGDVRFKREGKVYFIVVDEDDPGAFQIIFPAFWEVESVEERAKVLAAAEYSNRRSKVAKFYIVNENTWGSIELFLENPEDFKPLFSRCLRAMDNGVDNFVLYMQDKAK